MSTKLDRIIANGNPPESRNGEDSVIRCADGFKMSVIAHWGAYSIPRPDLGSNYPGPYTAVEVGFPSERPEPWADWETHCDDVDNPTETVYGQVPVEMVRALVEAHGGAL